VIAGGRRSEPQRSSGADAESGGAPLLIEIMGPAAAGKSTLLRALCAKDARIRAGLDLRKVEYVLPSLRRLGVFLPLWFMHHPRDRWLDRREMRSIARLETWSKALDTTPIASGAVAVFDHGPLYRLARLREFGPALTRSQAFERWWRNSLTRWSSALDIIVMLEAPDAVLLQRVDERGHWFLSGDLPAGDKHEFLDRYRRAFDTIMNEVDASPGATPIVLRLASGEMPVDAIAAEVLLAIASLRSTGDPRERTS